MNRGQTSPIPSSSMLLGTMVYMAMLVQQLITTHNRAIISSLSGTVHDANYYYLLLGVPHDASLNDIKAAYRKLVLVWHPDRNTNPEAQSVFQKISEAYEILSDPIKRANYNQSRFSNAQLHPLALDGQAVLRIEWDTEVESRREIASIVGLMEELHLHYELADEIPHDEIPAHVARVMQMLYPELELPPLYQTQHQPNPIYSDLPRLYLILMMLRDHNPDTSTRLHLYLRRLNSSLSALNTLPSFWFIALSTSYYPFSDILGGLSQPFGQAQFFYPLARDIFAQPAFNSSIPRSTVTMPGNSAEHTRFLDAGFSHDDIPKDKQHLICPLSMQLFTDPVANTSLGLPPVESSWILKAIEASYGKNPFNRKPLSASDLIPCEEIQAEVRAFVDKMIQNKESKSPK